MYYAAPGKVKSGPMVNPELNEKIHHCIHNDHNYFKNSKTIKLFYNIEKIYVDTLKKRNSTLINSINGAPIKGLGVKTLQGTGREGWLDDEVINVYF